MIIDERMVTYINSLDTGHTPFLENLERTAKQDRVPIIRREMQSFLKVFLKMKQPKRILEVGTAIGLSALLMAEYAPDAQITTVDRNEEMIGFAKENLAKYDSRKQITLVEGDAAEVLQDLDTDYDFVFMDSAKSKYIVFLPEILKRLKVGGVIVFDDIFQGGDIAKDIMEVRRGQRTIYRGLHRLFDATLDNPGLTASLVPMSDGLLMLRKNSENIILPD